MTLSHSRMSRAITVALASNLCLSMVPQRSLTPSPCPKHLTLWSLAQTRQMVKCVCRVLRRPYDLVAVPKHLVNAQHYVFSPFGVLHVHPEEGSEAMSLGDWHRDAVVWQLMQYIPFFRLFLVRKAFVR